MAKHRLPDDYHGQQGTSRPLPGLGLVIGVLVVGAFLVIVSRILPQPPVGGLSAPASPSATAVQSPRVEVHRVTIDGVLYGDCATAVNPDVARYNPVQQPVHVVTCHFMKVTDSAGDNPPIVWVFGVPYVCDSHLPANQPVPQTIKCYQAQSV